MLKINKQIIKKSYCHVVLKCVFDFFIEVSKVEIEFILFAHVELVHGLQHIQ